MSIDSDVFDILSGVASNVYPLIVPLGAPLPAVTYQRVSTDRVRSHEGDSLIGPLYQVTCWDSSPTGARALARDVVATCSALIGQMLVENELEGYAPSQKLYSVMVDVRIWAGQEEVAAS